MGPWGPKGSQENLSSESKCQQVGVLRIHLRLRRLH